MGNLSRLKLAKENSVRASRREATLLPLAKADDLPTKRDYELKRQRTTIDPHEDPILETCSIPLGARPCGVGGGATGLGPDTGATRHTDVGGADHHGCGGHRLLGRVCHGLGANERLAGPGVPENVCRSIP